MIKKILVICILVVIISGCLFVSTVSFIKYKEDYVTIYVASHQIAQRTKLSLIDLVEIKVPKQVINDDFYIDSNDIEGKYVRLGYSIPKGSYIYKGFLENDIKDLSYTLLLDDQVSFDLYTNEIRINTATLSDNMYLDIYLTINDNHKPYSDLLIKDCRIIGMYDNNFKQILSYDNQSRPYIISVAIEDSHVNILNKALKVGEVSIIINADTYKTMTRSSLYLDSLVMEYVE